jgi:undecaprenyl-diphosphatase
MHEPEDLVPGAAIRRTIERVARAPELRPVATALVIVAACWGFLELADEVREGDTASFDARVLEVLRRPDDPRVPIGPPWLVQSGRDLTSFGSPTILLLAIAAVSGFLALGRERMLLGLVLASGLGAMTINAALKAGYARARPVLVPHLTEVADTGFPSGHAMGSAAVYLSLGLLLARVLRRRIEKTYAIASAMLLTLLVGASRVYLGVHYPTDVLAGWLAGIAWALACGAVAEWIDRRRRRRS